ncbi:holin [Anoxybacillus gonensis]|uniref:BhlA/UviB family holin-like peptide n=1 Tax=Anoxybacillus gonensis TaxID=198467 RepID=A0AAW7TEF5_9BACL|nr:BhlA/UviB family holin-like peptide [Anoxybacillus gonensis]AKS37683.1 holin [Anoxybacillus gonensis]KGP61605.1 holin [Anoxybacillus gonensis]MDO0876499.1 BhlA/UviB family holin-like peptide [Anoxybacillus gonensis]
MDLTSIPIEQFVSNGVFATLFVWLLIDTRKESKEREQKLLEQIEKQNEAQERIVQAIERIEKKIEKMEVSMNG